MAEMPSGNRARRPRSWMFVPGNKPRFLEKAETLPLDVALFDLEDGVLPDEKAKARTLVAALLERAWLGPQRYVRLNAVTTPWFADDLEAVVRPGLQGVCMTKVDSVDELREGIEALGGAEASAGIEAGSVRVVAAIESARGLLAAPQIAACDGRIVALIFGAEDYALDLGLGAHRVEEAAELTYARSAIVVAAAAARVLSIDGVFPDLDDEQGCLRDMWQARRLGFTCKSTFNPRQVVMINDVFSPQEDEIAYARRLATAFDEARARGDASVAVGGQLVDLPILLRAIRVLEDIGER
ncbi:MAG: CoA ester lyase [Caulobacteraceae bacterium]|nr:CoA ester lyase [Caulobacteraceae bacterium]